MAFYLEGEHGRNDLPVGGSKEWSSVLKVTNDAKKRQ